MGAPNIVTYEKVLRMIQNETTLHDIEVAFIATTDMVRPDTIQRHISAMITMDLLERTGQVSYKKKADWETKINELKMRM